MRRINCHFRSILLGRNAFELSNVKVEYPDCLFKKGSLFVKSNTSNNGPLMVSRKIKCIPVYLLWNYSYKCYRSRLPSRASVPSHSVFQCCSPICWILKISTTCCSLLSLSLLSFFKSSDLFDFDNVVVHCMIGEYKYFRNKMLTMHETIQ